MKLTNNELNQVLKPFGFSHRTKAFKYFNNGQNKTFKKFVKVIEETELFNTERTQVLSLILLNYASNGASPQFGGYVINRAHGILTNNIRARKDALITFNNSLKTKTYDKWFFALKEYREYICDKALTEFSNYVDNEVANYDKPTNLVIKPEVTVVDNGLVKVIIETKTPEYKELTIKEIENILGYKIRIVG